MKAQLPPPLRGGSGWGGRGRRPRGRRLEGDHRRGSRLDADHGAGFRAAGVHCRRLRPVLRLAQLVALHRRASVHGRQPDGDPHRRGQVPRRPPYAGAGTDLSLFRPDVRSAARLRPALAVADGRDVAGRGGGRRAALHRHSEPRSAAPGRTAAPAASGQGAGDGAAAGHGRGGVYR